MIDDLDLGINFIRMPIIRNSEGLAFLVAINIYPKASVRMHLFFLER